MHVKERQTQYSPTASPDRPRTVGLMTEKLLLDYLIHSEGSEPENNASQ